MANMKEERSGQWLIKLEEELPLMGHGNWIVIADSAYPLRVSHGVKTVSTNAEPLHALDSVLSLLQEQRHIRPVVYLDIELQYLSEPEASGAGAFRESLARRLDGLSVHSRPHEQSMCWLDDAEMALGVLVLKTKGTIPYSSIFLQMDCKYWSEDSELVLQQRIRQAALTQPSAADAWEKKVFCLGDF
jgi:hypothetical protein